MISVAGGGTVEGVFAQGVEFYGPDALDTSRLLFGPFKILGLIVWVYLCLYCAQRVEFSPLIDRRYKPLATAACLLIGPFVFFVLVVADTAVKLQDGTLGADHVLGHLFGGAFVRRRHLSARGRPQEDFIQLLDSAGHDYFGDTLARNEGQPPDQEALELTRRLILDGIRRRASDILIDPKSSGVYTVRYRIDGFLQLAQEVDVNTCKAVVNCVKAIAGMDISERRRALDGAFMARIADGDVHFRVASAGVLGGEKLSIRVLNQATGLLGLNEIGLSEDSYRQIHAAIDLPQGMILVCGPTGSGKTTTLYAMLTEVDFYTRNVVTVEDPIEYVLPHASQIEVNPKANITFANSLRSILRQDPDIICIGEIRDGETAQMAVQSAHTGHLVLATLHSSSNLATLARLMDLGVRPLVLASALSVVISQRLVRRLCEHCKEPAELTHEQAEVLVRVGLNPAGACRPVGCGRCNDTGFYGRVAIVDVLHVDDALRAQLTTGRLSLANLKNEGDTKGRSHLRKEGLIKVAAGITTLEEVYRVTTHLG